MPSDILSKFLTLLPMIQFPLSSRISTYTLPVPLHQYSVEERQRAAFAQDNIQLPYPNPTKAFWTHGEPNANPLAKEGSSGLIPVQADIVIVGSGVTGVGVAYHLADLAVATGLTLDVVVLEARDFCSGATGRNGGHLTPTPFQGFKANSERYGVSEAIKSISLENHTATSILNIIKATKAEANLDLIQGNHLELFFSEREEADTKSDYELATQAGIDLSAVTFLAKEETQKSHGPDFPSVRYLGHNLWPLKFVTQIFNSAKDRFSGSNSTLHLHTHVPVTSVQAIGHTDVKMSSNNLPHRWSLQTLRGEIRTHIVVHATNGYAAHLLPFLAPSPGRDSIVPVRGQIIATRAAIPLKRLGIPSYGANDGFEYWFPRPVKNASEDSPLIILGGGREATGPIFELGIADDSILNPNTSKVLRGFLPSVYPDGWFPKNEEPEMEWTGVMGFTESRNPFVGPVIDSTTKSVLKGQYISAGYSGHGMPRAFGCAEALAQLIIADLIGKTWSPPDWFPHHFLTTER